MDLSKLLSLLRDAETLVLAEMGQSSLPILPVPSPAPGPVVPPPVVVTFPPAPAPTNPPPDNGISWHASVHFSPAKTKAQVNFNYLMSLRSVFGLCYGALSLNIGNDLSKLVGIGTETEQKNIINTFQNSSYNFGAPRGLFLPTSPSIHRKSALGVSSLWFKWGEPMADQVCEIILPYPDTNELV